MNLQLVNPIHHEQVDHQLKVLLDPGTLNCKNIPPKQNFHIYNPDWVDDQLSHDESVGKYVMMNRVKKHSGKIWEMLEKYEFLDALDKKMVNTSNFPCLCQLIHGFKAPCEKS